MSIKTKTAHSEYSHIAEAHDNDIIVSSREIFIYGHTEDGEDEGINSRISMNFLKNIQILNDINHTPIIIHQQSIGGEWESGMMIYDVIQQSPSPFIFICHGVAASMGSIIPQAVYKRGVRITMPNCYWLIHEGEQSISGTTKQVQSYYEFTRLSRSQMYNIYSEVCFDTGERFKGMTKARAKSWIRRKLESKEDWWLTAEDAVTHGFVDGVVGSEKYKSITDLKKGLV